MASPMMKLMGRIPNAFRGFDALPGLSLRGIERRYSAVSHESSAQDRSEGNANVNKVDANPDVSLEADTHADILQPQGLDPGKGWDFRGVYKQAIICGRVERAPEQKLLGGGGSVTLLSVSTGGMFDYVNTIGSPAHRLHQWHRIVVHNERLASYAVRHLMKGATVYVEGDMETRVYNDDINGMVKRISEICIRRDGHMQHLDIISRHFLMTKVA